MGGIATGAAGAGIAGGLGGLAFTSLAGPIAGALISGKGRKYKRRSAFSAEQKEVNKLFFDWLMGIIRNAGGNEIFRDPIFTKLIERNKWKPPRPVAPLTQRQQDLLERSGGLLERMGNLRRPDTGFQKELRDRYLTKTPGALPGLAHGGIVEPGQAVVVGENKPEIAVALEGGGLEIIPNPETFKNPAEVQKAIKASQSAAKKYGIPGKQLGTIFDPLDPKRYLDFEGSRFYTNQFAPTSFGADFTAEEFKPFQTGFESSPYFQSFRDHGIKIRKSVIDRYLAATTNEEFVAAATEGYRRPVGRSEASDNRITIPDYYGKAFDVVGGDIGQVGDINARQEYFTQLGNYINTLPLIDQQNFAGTTLPGTGDGTIPDTGTTTTFGQTAAQSLLSSIPGFGQEGFNPQEWNTFLDTSQLGVNAQKYKLGIDPISGQFRLADPFVTSASLQTLINTFVGQQPGEPPPPIDFSSLLASIGGIDENITQDEAADYNAFLQTYQGGTLGQYKVNFNPSTGQMEFGEFQNGVWRPVTDDVKAGLDLSAEEFKIDIVARQLSLDDLNNQQGDITFANADMIRSTSGSWIPDPTRFEQIDGIWQAVDPNTGPTGGTMASIQALKNELAASFLRPFDPLSALEAFEGNLEEPAWQSFFDRTVPAIEEAFGGVNLFSSAPRKAKLREIERLTKELEVNRTGFLFQAEQAHKDRKAAAFQIAIQLEELPSTISTKAANIDHINSLTAATWSTIEINEALVEANISETEASIYAILAGIFSIEQSQQQKEFEAAFLDSLEVDGFDVSTLLNLLIQFQGQAQTVFVPK